MSEHRKPRELVLYFTPIYNILIQNWFLEPTEKLLAALFASSPNGECTLSREVLKKHCRCGPYHLQRAIKRLEFMKIISVHLKETMDIVNQSLSIAYSNLGKYYREEDKMMQRLLRTQKAIESYLIQLNNGTDPDTIIQELREASRHIHYLKVVLNQTAYVTGYIENAFFTLEDFFTYSN